MVGEEFCRSWAATTCETSLGVKVLYITQTAWDTNVSYDWKPAPVFDVRYLVRHNRQLALAFAWHAKRHLPFYLMYLKERLILLRIRRVIVLGRRLQQRNDEPRWRRGRWKASA
jgi:hypothetical protein